MFEFVNADIGWLLFELCSSNPDSFPNKKGGCTTRILPATMKTLRKTRSKVNGLLRRSLSMKTLNTGEVKPRTIKSPKGMYGITARKVKLMEDIENP